MRICHVITTIHYAGAQRLLVNLANLHAARHDIDLVYFKDEPDLVPELDPTIRVHRVELGRGASGRLRRLLEELQPDVLHTHLGHADFLGHWAGRRLRLRRFCTMHNVWFKWNWKDRLIFQAYRTLFRRVVPDCHVLCISRVVHEHVRRRLGVPTPRATVVYNAIPHIVAPGPRPALRAELEIPCDAFCVLFVGRLEVQKSVDTLLEAAQRMRDRVPELLILLVGAGREEARLRQRTRDLGLEGTVRFCGTTRAPERYFAAADAFALPSVFEGFGLVVLEAFRAALPVVATDIEGPAELIESGKNGLLVPPADPARLADRLLQLRDNPALRQRLGRAGADTFSEQYSIERYAAQIESLYEAAAHRGDGTRRA